EAPAVGTLAATAFERGLPPPVRSEHAFGKFPNALQIFPTFRGFNTNETYSHSSTAADGESCKAP
ncbi:hypothetical protein, partial [Cupriavidus sp.]|uniref:hypothetical protein n=1 Tax=Cupriavidus sp. TaxID=1873897 RepID=UPI003D09D567